MYNEFTNMKEKIENLIKNALKNLGINDEIDFIVEHPEDFKKWRLLDKCGDGLC